MFELRRLTKIVKQYVYFFQNEPEEFKENIDFYINDLKNLIEYTGSYILTTQNELNSLYEANINLFALESFVLFKPFVFIIMKLLEKMMNTKSQNILLVKRYQKYFRNFLESLEKMKYLCDL